MLLSRCRRSVGCENDTICFGGPLLGVVEVLAGQVLIEGLDIVRKASVQSAARVWMADPEGIGTTRMKLF